MNTISKNTIFVLMITIFISNNVYSQGFSGTIYFRDGKSIYFNYLGSMDNPSSYTLYGKIGMQNVEYKLHELKEIIFTEKSKGYICDSYYRNTGSIIIISRDNKRFTIDDGCLYGGKISYVYNDPVTKNVKANSQKIKNTIQSITIGNDVGRSKYNPNTKEYFPSHYNYDPFTGEKLIWADRK